jgi:hypothetical protein
MQHKQVVDETNANNDAVQRRTKRVWCGCRGDGTKLCVIKCDGLNVLTEPLNDSPFGETGMIFHLVLH